MSEFRVLSSSDSPELENNDQIYHVRLMILTPNFSVTVSKPSVVLEGLPKGGMKEF